MLRAIYQLFFGRRFEFYSAYNMDEAIRRLEERSRDDVILPNSRMFRARRWRLNIQEDPYNWGYYNFLCRPRWGFRRTNHTIVKGQLQPDARGIYVKGIIRFDRLSSILILGVPISLPIHLWLNIGNQNYWSSLILIFATVFMIDVIISRLAMEKKLRQLITSTLE